MPAKNGEENHRTNKHGLTLNFAAEYHEIKEQEKTTAMAKGYGYHSAHLVQQDTEQQDSLLVESL